MIYDFVLFENFYLALNHYKDICIIADLLIRSGYTVAIADVFGEKDNCQIAGVPHITFEKKCPVDFCFDSDKKGVVSMVKNYIKRKQIDNYLKYVMRQLRGQYRNLYAGSYFIHMTTGWLKEIPKECVAFFWGLRSSRLIEYKLTPLQLRSYDAYKLKKYFERHQNLKFFVSDEIIRNEFLNLGVSSKRLVLRPERILEKIPEQKSEKTINKDELCLLSIGSLRENKRIEVILDAAKNIKDKGIHYVIAGKADPSYENVIKLHIGELDIVERRNYRLSETEYNNLIKECDFLILCDKQQQSSVTNGTMNEALLNSKPIIAPNYNPYRFFIDEYKIGVTFDPDEPLTLRDAILEAKAKGSMSFIDNIHKYQETLLMDHVVSEFSKELAIAIS